MANLNKSALASASSSTFTDNTSGLITPVLHRTYNTNTIDSFLTSKDASSLEAVMLENRSSSKASANTVDLSTADGNLVHITTGTPDIAGFGTVQAGARFVLVFDVAITLLYNITSLILPTGANIVTAAGDTAFMISEGGGYWRCVAYQRASGAALVGGGGGGTWGTITGTLSAQTDLQAALNTKVDENAAITGATKTKITYDSKGLVTAGAAATTADIADSTDKRYVTDTQLTVIGNTSGTNTGDQTLSGLGGVASNTAITGATKTKITYDSKGLVTAGGDAAITELSDVTISSPANNEALVYEASSSKWKNKAVTGTGTVTTTGTALTSEMTKFSGETIITKAIAGTDYVDVGSIIGNGQIMNTAKMLGRTTASSGAIEEIAIGSGLTLSGGTLINSATPTPVGYYGQAFDYNIQTATTNNIGVPIIFGTTDLSNGVTVVSNGTSLTRITFANTGIYNLQFSVQLQNLANATEDVHIWLRLNGADVVGSTGVIGMQARKSAGNASHTISGWNYLLDVIGGQYYELIWATTDVANVDIRFYASTANHPSTASTLFTVTQQSGIMAGTGLTALNGLSAITNPVQLFATGTDYVDNDWFIDSSGDTHIFNIPSASASTRGLLTAVNFAIFSAKQATLVSGTNIKTFNGATILGSGAIAIPCEIQTAVSDETTTLTTGTSKMTFRMPYAMTVTSVRASVNTAPTGSAITVDVKENGTSIMTTTKISIPVGTKTSVGSGTPVLTDTALADDSEISIDILAVGSTFGGSGLKVTIIGTRV